MIAISPLETTPVVSNYELIDSGAGEKLEQVGEVLLARPSSLALWSKREPKNTWLQAHARFLPDRGWQVLGRDIAPEDFHFTAEFAGLKIEASLLRNGQVGFFPEHAATLPTITRLLSQRSDPSVLNLFGYTGLATVCALSQGAQVTHVDINQPALDSLKRNVEGNGLDGQRLKIFKEDALGYLQRMARGERHFDLIILDPPNFSRFAKNKSWDLEQVICPMLELCAALLAKKRGAVCFSSHHPALVKELVAGLTLEYFPADYSSTILALGLQDRAGRVLPHGGLTVCAPMA